MCCQYRGGRDRPAQLCEFPISKDKVNRARGTPELALWCLHTRTHLQSHLCFPCIYKYLHPSVHLHIYPHAQTHGYPHLYKSTHKYAHIPPETHTKIKKGSKGMSKGKTVLSDSGWLWGGRPEVRAPPETQGRPVWGFRPPQSLPFSILLLSSPVAWKLLAEDMAARPPPPFIIWRIK